MIPEEYAADDDDLGVCPYLARWECWPGFDPEATCIFGCYDEPACVTCRPREGWPSVKRWFSERLNR